MLAALSACLLAVERPTAAAIRALRRTGAVEERREQPLPGDCDPADSWLAYAESRNPGQITSVHTSFVVPPLPSTAGSLAAFWFGLEPTPACDLLQPVLALGRLSAPGWAVFNERFDWINGSKDYYPESASDMVAVQPGDRVNASMHWSAAASAYTLRVASARGAKSASLPAEPKQNYSRLFFVVEHQPDSCDMLPAAGITFEDIAVRVGGEPRAQRFETVRYKDACGCAATAVDSATVSFRWNDGR